MTELEGKAFDILKKNRVVGPGFAYTRPGGHYRNQWFWDSCFHAQVLRHLDPDFAKKELLSLFRFQDKTGFAPHLSFHLRPWQSLWLWGRWGSSGLIQPPIVADAAWAVYEADRDHFFLSKIYPKLAAYYRFILKYRDEDADDLFSYVHPWESGWDQSVEWDFAFRTHFKTRKQWRFALGRMILPFRILGWDQRAMQKWSHFNVEAADGNALFSYNLYLLAKIARVLGKEREAARWEEVAGRIEQAVLIELWNGQTFVDRHITRQEHLIIAKKTPIAFFPLLLPHLREEQKDKLLQSLTEEFMTVPFPLPTAAPSEPSFNPVGYWRGTTWVNVNYLIVRGLWQQEEYDLAADLVDLTAKLVQKSGFHEYYHPLSGQGLGTRDFSWSSLVVDLLKRRDESSGRVLLPVRAPAVQQK